VYFVYLFRSYCLGKDSNAVTVVVRTAKLGMPALLVFAVALAPIVHTEQLHAMLSRLFPFGRGLTHAYWAPNIWALYAFVDRSFGKLVGHGSSAVGSTSGLAEVVPMLILPNVSPKTTLVVAGFLYLPLLCLVWKMCCAGRSSASLFPFLVCMGMLVGFLGGWHVHEKAILMSTIPLTIAVLIKLKSTSTRNDNLAFLLVAILDVSNFSIMPLLHRRQETILKWTIFLAFGCFSRLLVHRHASYEGTATKHNGIICTCKYIVPSTLLCLGFYSTCLHGVLSDKFEFLDLMMTSVVCACWLLFLFASLVKVWTSE